MSARDIEPLGDLTPYQDGYEALVYGVGRDACPWLPETDECVDWLRGWDDAHQEDNIL
jgi:ribosome modulation factor